MVELQKLSCHEVDWILGVPRPEPEKSFASFFFAIVKFNSKIFNASDLTSAKIQCSFSVSCFYNITSLFLSLYLFLSDYLSWVLIIVSDD